MDTTVRHRKLALLWLLALIASTLAIYWTMLGARYFYDDIFHLGFVAQRDELGVWLLVPHNDHLMPLMRFIYYLCFQISGLDALPLMALLMVAHLANIWLVFVLTSDFADQWEARWSPFATSWVTGSPRSAGLRSDRLIAAAKYLSKICACSMIWEIRSSIEDLLNRGVSAN